MTLNNQLLHINKIGGMLYFLLSPLQFGYFIFAEKVYRNQLPNFKYFFDGYKKFFPVVKLYFINIFIYLIIILIFLIPILNTPDVQEIITITSNNPDAIKEGTLPELSLLTGVLILLMLAVFLCAGILTSFASYLLWFQNVGALKAIVLSIQIIKKQFSKWIIFAGMLILLNFAGLLLFGIGVFVTMPVSMLAFYAAYEDIAGAETEVG
jgi:uncharacterized membrane protein